MKIHIYIATLALISISQLLKAQTAADENRVLTTVTSAEGNYVYLLGQKELFTKDSLILNNIDHFIILKAAYDPKTVDKVESLFKKIGIAKPVSSEKELRANLTPSNIAEMKKYFSLTTDQDLVKYFQTHQTLSSYSLFFKMIETRITAGQIFFDKDVNKDEVVIYKVIRVDKDKTEKPWGYAITQSKVGNYALQYIKPIVEKVVQADSSMAITWKVNINSMWISKLPKPISKIQFDKDGYAFKMPFPYTDLRARVHLMVDGKYEEVEKMLPTVIAGGDSITFTYYKKTKREELVSAYLTLEDEVYNKGRSSDTTNIYAITEKYVPLIYGIKVTDIVDGVHIAWKQLPEKPYFRGIEIVRYNSQDKLDSVAVLSPLDTVYNDYAMQIGQHYRYFVRPLFLPGMANLQKIPAQGVGGLTKFSKPTVPFNLASSAEEKNVRLKWENQDKPSFFGYFIYRGTSPKRMSLIAGPVKVKTYLDTAGALSGRSHYYYAVATQNMRQDTSGYSNITEIRPARKMNIAPPTDIEFYFANGKLDVRWKDVRVDDNIIESFILQKKKKDDAAFTIVKLKTSSAIAYTDSDIVRGETYQYRVASVADNGEVSEFSTAMEFMLEKKPVETIGVFYVRTVPEGVAISLPEMTYPNRKAYNIYKRKADGADFIKAATINAGTFSFTDEKVEPDTIYVYTISITETDDRESALGKSISVRSNAK